MLATSDRDFCEKLFFQRRNVLRLIFRERGEHARDVKRRFIKTVQARGIFCDAGHLIISLNDLSRFFSFPFLFFFFFLFSRTKCYNTRAHANVTTPTSSYILRRRKCSQRLRESVSNLLCAIRDGKLLQIVDIFSILHGARRRIYMVYNKTH